MVIDSKNKIEAWRRILDIEVATLIFFLAVSSFTNYEDTASFIKRLLDLNTNILLWFAMHLLCGFVGIRFLLKQNKIRLEIELDTNNDPMVKRWVDIVFGWKSLLNPKYKRIELNEERVAISKNKENSLESFICENEHDIDIFPYPKYWENDGQFSEREVIRVYFPLLKVSIEYRYSPDILYVYRRRSDEKQKFPDSYERYNLMDLKSELKLLNSTIV